MSNVRPRMSKPVVTIDGELFEDLPGFYKHFQKQALDGASWGNNLDAFNDVLRGGFGTPEEGFILLWQNHLLSKQRLGYEETERVLQERLKTCHQSNQEHVAMQLSLAHSKQGETVFDWLVGILRIHGPGGSEQEDGVELVLR